MKTRMIELLAVLAVLSPATASAQTFPANDIIGKQESRSRKFWINNNVPAACQRPVYDAMITWNAATPNVNFVWSGYTNAFARSLDSAGKSVSTSSNTVDHWIEMGATQNVDAFGELAHRYRNLSTGSYGTYVFYDGDHVINSDKQSSFYCGSLATIPADKRDMQSHTLHESGHSWGLDHDTGDTTGVTAMYRYGQWGKATRALHDRDIRRTIHIYGTRP
jgi:hypothetical protein